MRKHFLTGLILLMPIALTLMVIIFLFHLFTHPFVPIVAKLVLKTETDLGFTLPSGLSLFISQLLALILLCLVIFLLGIIARWFLIRDLLSMGHKILSRIPIIKTVYKVSSDIFTALFSNDGKKAFKHAVMVPFPAPPAFSMGFHAGEVCEEIKQKIKEPLVPVFMPTAPHPISGFLFFVPQKDAHKIDMSNEDVVKFLVSCGMIYPKEKNLNLNEEL